MSQELIGHWRNEATCVLLLFLSTQWNIQTLSSIFQWSRVAPRAGRGRRVPDSLQFAHGLTFWSSYHLMNSLPIPCPPISFTVPQMPEAEARLAPVAAGCCRRRIAFLQSKHTLCLHRTCRDIVIISKVFSPGKHGGNPSLHPLEV